MTRKLKQLAGNKNINLTVVDTGAMWDTINPMYRKTILGFGAVVVS